MKNFSKTVKLIGGSRVQFHFPLSTGQDMFEADKEYEILSTKDFHRLMEHGDFICLNPDVEVVPVPEEKTEEEEIVEAPVELNESFLGGIKKKNNKDKNEVQD